MNKRALLVHGVIMTLLTILLTILLAQTLFLSFVAAAAYGYPMPFITPVVEREGSTIITTYRGNPLYFIGLGILASAPLSYGLRRVFGSTVKGYVYGAVVVIVLTMVVIVLTMAVAFVLYIDSCTSCAQYVCAKVKSCSAKSGLFYANTTNTICTCA